MEVFDLFFAKITLDLLLNDESDLMRSKMYNNFPTKKKIISKDIFSADYHVKRRDKKIQLLFSKLLPRERCE
jgi:hypothetical protein